MAFLAFDFKPVEARCALAPSRLIYAKKYLSESKKRESKLSTKDLLALASMKNAAKREM
jgi:hypothetical protein